VANLLLTSLEATSSKKNHEKRPKERVNVAKTKARFFTAWGEGDASISNKTQSRIRLRVGYDRRGLRSSTKEKQGRPTYLAEGRDVRRRSPAKKWANKSSMSEKR